MDAHPFLLAIFGGALIGISASMLLLLVGRIAGICGILGGLIEPISGDVLWRGVFIMGLLVGGVMLVFSSRTMQPIFCVQCTHPCPILNSIRFAEKCFNACLTIEQKG